MTKNRLATENKSYEWYAWLISHIPESMKNSVSDAKENIMELFETKIIKICIKKNTQRPLQNQFVDSYNKYKNNGNRKLSTE